MTYEELKMAHPNLLALDALDEANTVTNRLQAWEALHARKLSGRAAETDLVLRAMKLDLSGLAFTIC